MTLNKDQRKKASDIFEKIGVTILIVSSGDLIIGPPSIRKFLIDIFGALLGIILLITSIFALKGISKMEDILSSIMIVIVGILGLIFALTILYIDRKGRREKKAGK
jgi:hypothetical protein